MAQVSFLLMGPVRPLAGSWFLEWVGGGLILGPTPHNLRASKFFESALLVGIKIPYPQPISLTSLASQDYIAPKFILTLRNWDEVLTYPKATPSQIKESSANRR